MELGFNGKEIARQKYHENALSKARLVIATSFGNNTMNRQGRSAPLKNAGFNNITCSLAN
ncbi:MAG TPA: hypothetical protein VK625_20305 [Flavitalea sp.]|nr:hypothetical protein [Flavitalea sp.]